MKRIYQNKKRQASVSTRPKRPTQPQKKYILESKKSDSKLNNKLGDTKKTENSAKEINIDLQPKPSNYSSVNDTKVSPQVIRTSFDSIKVYLENMKAFYLNQADKLNATVKQMDQKVEFVIPRK